MDAGRSGPEDYSGWSESVDIFNLECWGECLAPLTGTRWSNSSMPDLARLREQPLTLTEPKNKLKWK